MTPMTLPAYTDRNEDREPEEDAGPVLRLVRGFLTNKATRLTAQSVQRALVHARFQGEATRTRQQAAAARTIKTIEEAVMGIGRIGLKLVELRALIAPLQEDGNVYARTSCAKRYEEMRNEIDLIAMSATYLGLNLIDGTDAHIRLMTGMTSRTAFTISHTNLTAGRKGLGLPALRFAFTHEIEIKDALHCIGLAQKHLHWAMNVYRQEALYIQRRTNVRLNKDVWPPKDELYHPPEDE